MFLCYGINFDTITLLFGCICLAIFSISTFIHERRKGILEDEDFRSRGDDV